MTSTSRIVRRYRWEKLAQGGENPPIWVNVWDDSPPEAIIEVNFHADTENDFAREYPGAGTPLDTLWRWNFLQWLKAQTRAAGYVVHEEGIRRNWQAPLPAEDNRLVKMAHIEKAFSVESPKWPGRNPLATWNEPDHHEFLHNLIDLYQRLGSWMGIPLEVTCES